MTTDITELAQSLKAAAEKATPGPWALARDRKTVVSNQSHPITNLSDAMHRMLADGTTGQDAEFISLANPNNVIALVEALEKAQQRIDELENDEVRQRLANAEHQLYMAELAKNNLRASRKAQFRKRKAAEQRIAELESRTVTVKLPQRLQPGADGWDDWYVHSDDEGEYLKFDDVLAMLTAAGIKVEAE
ncbi:TPA: ead/Ea22-like family protein [Klebsiella pneumoniae subsp. pneumoniae]|uniref:ead/Ea22-like family protein n=1 Tax=Klebsiella sp. JB_Kp006 TaxID=3153359 RepID=UPI0032B362B4|nr:ead/Ea22-like family protein [Klebsiella pneumoniae subsp. pneumoniae]